MPPIKSLDATSRKWSRVAQASTPAYEEGVRSPKADWAENTANAAGNYSAGVSAAVADGRFEKGVRAAGSTKWQRNAIAKGPQRYAQGVRLAEDAYKRGFAPYREVIANTTLPDRRPTGDPGNIERVAVLAQALHAKKLEQLGG